MSRRAHVQTLFIPPHSLVDRATGELDLNRILIPVGQQPAPTAAIQAIQRFYRLVPGAGRSGATGAKRARLDHPHVTTRRRATAWPCLDRAAA